jgi:hypothetical protein
VPRPSTHVTRERDRRIAKGMGRAFTKGKKGSDTQRARKATGEGKHVR